MATIPPPPPPNPPDQHAQDGDNFAQFAGGPPPWSGSAITAFISSLLICIPVVPSLVGLVAGVMGISSTSGGRKRGRGLAIAAIPISLLAGAGWVFAIMFMVTSARGLMDMKGTLEQVFKARNLSDADLQEWIESRMAAGAADSTSPARLREWVGKVIADKGSLAEVLQKKMRTEQTPGSTGPVIILPCRFVNGTADVRMVTAVSLKGGVKFLIEDIKVGEHSLVDQP